MCRKNCSYSCKTALTAAKLHLQLQNCSYSCKTALTAAGAAAKKGAKSHVCNIPHNLLWDKLNDLGLDNKFITIMKSIYANSSTKILINGHLTKTVNINQGIMQGCVLSPLLFNLYISGIGHMLEKSPLGCKLNQVIISGLLYVDDLILIGNNRAKLEELLHCT